MIKKDWWSWFVLTVYALVIVLVAGLVIFAYGAVDFYLKEDTGGYLLGNVPLTALAFALYMVLLWCAGRIGRARAEFFLARHGAKLIALLSFLTLGMQVFICYHTYFISNWDMKTVVESALAFARREYEYVSTWYFSQCPNNITLMALYGYLLRTVMELLGIEPGIERFMVMLIMMQSVINVLTGVLVWRVTGDMLSEQGQPSQLAALGAWGMYFVLIGCSPWYLMPYSDSTALLLPLLTVFVYGRWRTSVLPTGVVIGLMAGAAYLIKPQTAIPAIAVVLNEAEGCVVRGERKKRLAFLGAAMFSALLMIGPAHNALVKSIDIDFDEEKRLGFVHYFMLGLNDKTDGQWDSGDVEAAMQYETNAERDAFELQMAVERIRTFGVSGMLDHLLKKCMVNFSDGSFTWKGIFNARRLMEEKHPVISPLLRDIVYEDGQRYLVLHTVQQGVWLFLLAASALGVLAFRRSSLTDSLRVCMLSTIGIIFFNMIFESRARYIYVMVPVIIPLAACALSSLRAGRSKWKNG